MSFDPITYALCKSGDSGGSSGGGGLPVIEVTEYDPNTLLLSDEATAQLKNALATSDFAIIKTNLEIGLLTPLLVQKFDDKAFVGIVTGIGLDATDKEIPVKSQIIIGLEDGLGLLAISSL